MELEHFTRSHPQYVSFEDEEQKCTAKGRNGEIIHFYTLDCRSNRSTQMNVIRLLDALSVTANHSSIVQFYPLYSPSIFLYELIYSAIFSVSHWRICVVG